MRHEYEFKTKQGYKIKCRWRLNDRLYVIAKRESDQTYIVCLGYDMDSGTWALGMYNYRTINEAQNALLKNLEARL